MKTSTLLLSLLLPVSSLVQSKPSSRPSTQPVTNTAHAFQFSTAERQYGPRHVMSSPDGTKLAIGTLPKGASELTGAIFDAATGKSLFATKGNANGSFWFTGFSPDSRIACFIHLATIASPKDEKSYFEMIELPTGRIIRKQQTSESVGPLFSPDSTLYSYRESRTSNGVDESARHHVVAEVTSGTVIARFEAGSEDRPRAISPDNRTMVSSLGGLWSFSSNKRISYLARYPSRGVGHIAFSPDSKTIIAIVSGEFIWKWDASNGQLISVTPLQLMQLRQGRFAHSLSTDGTTAYYFQLSSQVAAFDTGTGRPLGIWSPAVPNRSRWEFSYADPGPSALVLRQDDRGPVVTDSSTPFNVTYWVLKIPDISEFTPPPPPPTTNRSTPIDRSGQ